MTDEPDDEQEEVQEVGFEASIPEHVTCHNHVILFPWGSDTFADHLKGLAIRIDAATANIEIFDQDEHVWRPAAKQPTKLVAINAGKKP